MSGKLMFCDVLLSVVKFEVLERGRTARVGSRRSGFEMHKGVSDNRRRFGVHDVVIGALLWSKDRRSRMLALDFVEYHTPWTDFQSSTTPRRRG